MALTVDSVSFFSLNSTFFIELIFRLNLLCHFSSTKPWCTVTTQINGVCPLEFFKVWNFGVIFIYWLICHISQLVRLSQIWLQHIYREYRNKLQCIRKNVCFFKCPSPEPFKALWVKTSTLNRAWKTIGSPYNSCKMGVEWWNLLTYLQSQHPTPTSSLPSDGNSNKTKGRPVKKTWSPTTFERLAMITPGEHL